MHGNLATMIPPWDKTTQDVWNPSSDSNKSTLAGCIDRVQEHKGKDKIYFLVERDDTSCLTILLLLKDFEINEINPMSTRNLMIDAMQTRGLLRTQLLSHALFTFCVFILIHSTKFFIFCCRHLEEPIIK